MGKRAKLLLTIGLVILVSGYLTLNNDGLNVGGNIIEDNMAGWNLVNPDSSPSELASASVFTVIPGIIFPLTIGLLLKKKYSI